MDLKEVFEVIKNANTSSAVFTTHDKGVAEAEREHILNVLKAKWPQEAAMLSTAVPSYSFNSVPSKL
jgi:hypothetical protein